MKLTIRKYESNKGLYKILLACSVVLTIWCIFELFSFAEYWYVVFIPITYIMTRVLISKSFYMLSPGIVTYELVCFMRYVILPFVIISQRSLSRFAVSYNYLGYAVGLIIYEMLGTSMVILFYRPQTIQKHTYNVQYVGGNKRLIFSFTVVALLLLYLSNRSLTGNLQIFSGITNSAVAEQLGETSSIITILWQAMLSFVFAYTIWSIYSSSKLKIQDTFRAIISSLLCIVYFLIIFTGQVSISRWYVMISAIASIIWLMTLYPNSKVSILLTVGIPFAIALVMVSVLKSGGVTALEYNRFEQINNFLTPEFVDTYFAGPVNVNNAIAMKSKGGIGIFSLPYDVLNNMPFITNVIDRTQSTVYAYNHLLGRTDQIIPLIGQSFTWFGYGLSPLLSMIFVALFMRYDFKFIYSYGIDKYCYGFFAAWCSVAIILNTTIWFAWLYSKVIPMFMLYGLIRQLIIRKKKAESVGGETIDA